MSSRIGRETNRELHFNINNKFFRECEDKNSRYAYFKLFYISCNTVLIHAKNVKKNIKIYVAISNEIIINFIYNNENIFCKYKWIEIFR